MGLYGYWVVGEKKERLIPLNDKACVAPNNYVKVRSTGNSSLFLNRFGEPLGERELQKMLRKYLQKVGIQRAGVHTLRHTLALHHISKGMSVKTLQDAMGHKDTRSIMIYVSLVGEMRNRLQRNAL
jgi:integrase/recombinase XerD